MKKLASILAIIILSFSSLFAQDYSTTNKKAIALYEEAIQNFQWRYFDKTEELLNKALSVDANFFEAYYLLAGVYTEQKQIDNVIEILKKCVANCGDQEPWAYYKLAFEQVEHGYYKDAIENLNLLKTKNFDFSPKQQSQFEILYAQAATAVKFMENPVPFDPQNLGPQVNSKYNDYHPTITVDDNVLIFTSLVPSPYARTNQEDLFYCVRTPNGWQQRLPMMEPINTPTNEGAQSISADGKRMILTRCNAPGGYGSCDIYITEVFNNRWSEPENLGPIINTNKWESQPSLTADGRTLYFVSNRDGGFGKKDIWMSTQNEDGEWTQPVNLGPAINTAEEDESPFIHADGVTLYFSSDGHPGVGKTDIFMSRRSGMNWSEPKNLGYPINTHKKESYMIVNAPGTKAYFASNRFGSIEGSMDIYEFEVPENIRPDAVTYVRGAVYDATQTNKKLGADIKLKELESGELVYNINSDHYDGSFILPFVEQKEYALTISHKGYLFYSENVSLKSVGNALNVPLQPLIVGKTVVLNNVFFDTDSDILKQASRTELMTIVQFMKQNPTVHFEVGGHTDNVGTKEYNKTLSTKRAKAVYDFLVEHGIDAARLSYKGYADEKPIAENSSEEGRAKNRRTELIITQQ